MCDNCVILCVLLAKHTLGEKSTKSAAQIWLCHPLQLIEQSHRFTFQVSGQVVNSSVSLVVSQTLMATRGYTGGGIACQSVRVIRVSISEHDDDTSFNTSGWLWLVKVAYIAILGWISWLIS